MPGAPRPEGDRQSARRTHVGDRICIQPPEGFGALWVGSGEPRQATSSEGMATYGKGGDGR